MTNTQPADHRSGYPQQLWPDYAQARAQQVARPWPTEPVKGQQSALAVVGVLGLAVCMMVAALALVFL